MKVCILNDTTDYHKGCTAVMTCLTQAIERANHITTLPAKADAVVVNGEGSMHDDKTHALLLLKSLERAQSEGKRTYLLNSVWQNMENGFDHVLKKLDRLTVREVKSQRELKEKHGIDAEICLDLSYWASLSTPYIDVTGEIIMGDMFHKEHRELYELPYIKISLRWGDWSKIVNTLSRAKLYITGRHHGVYAACKAQTPFIAFKGNTHKIEGLIETAGVDIPVYDNHTVLHKAIPDAFNRMDEYTKLFEWMESQPEFKF